MNIKKIQSNYQDVLKTIAIISMIIDHIGLYFFPGVLYLRMIGRIAMPIFCFFAGYNFHQKIKHSILIYGLILYVCTAFVLQNASMTNILFTIYLGQIYLLFMHKNINNYYIAYAQVILLAALYPWIPDILEYSTIAIAIMVLGYMSKIMINDIKYNAFAISILSCIFNFDVLFMRQNSYYYDYYSYIYCIWTIINLIIIYLMLTSYGFKKPVSFNVFALIGRNVLYIYFVHLMLIDMILWYLLYIGKFVLV
ncbi:MAG: TraX family protein [Rickettsiaceae bacterium]